MQPHRGFAVFLVVALIALVSALAMAAVMATSTDSRIAAAFISGMEARYAAEAGAHRALIDLATQPDFSLAFDGLRRSTFVDGPPGGVRSLPGGYSVDLDLVRSLADCGHAPPCTDAELDAVTARRPWGANNPRWQLFAYGPLASLLPAGLAPSRSYLVALVADDPAEGDGNPIRDGAEPDAGAGVLRLRAEAFGPAGAHHAVELTARRAGSGAPGLTVVSWRELPD
jgi:hypothetical protein